MSATTTPTRKWYRGGLMVRSYRWELWGKHFRDVGKFSLTTPHDVLMILLPFGNSGQILLPELPSW